MGPTWQGARMSATVITGANRGIGLELCRQCKARGEDVIAIVRKTSDALDALGVRVEADLDVSNDAVVGALRERLAGVDIGVLINNAGILRRQGLDDMNWDGMRQQFEVNSLGPLRVTTALLGNLSSGSKVAIVTSRMGSIADNDSGGSYGYRMSKAAVNAAAVSLANDLRGKGIAVAVLHPGWVKTEMTNGTGMVDAKESAGGLIARIDALTLETSGGFWHMNGERLPW